MSVTQELAKRILDFRYEDLPEDAVFWAKQAITDTVGVTFAGSREPTARIPANLPGIAQQDGPCLVFGGNKRTAAMDAVLVNGTASFAIVWGFGALIGSVAGGWVMLGFGSHGLPVGLALVYFLLALGVTRRQLSLARVQI